MAKVTLDKQSFAKRMNLAMANAPLDRHTLAAAVGAHPNRIGDWMRGARWPDLANMASLAQVLDVEIEWLLTGRTTARRPSPAPVDLEAVGVARDLARLAPRLVTLAERAQRSARRN
jgi:transcriptional regulator with XRE-family HTH domain